MKFFSKALEKIKKCIFIDEFDEIYKNSTTRAIFVLYCCCGGFSFHNDVRTTIRKVWIIFNVFNFLFMHLSCLFYLYNIPTKDYYILLLPALAMSAFLGKVSLYLWIYSGKDVFSKLIDFFNNTDDDEDKTFASFCTTFLMKPRAEFIIGVCCFLILCSMTSNFENYVNYENYFVPLYPTYFPYDKTTTSRIVIRFIQSVTLIPELIAFVTFPTLVIMVTVNIHNRFELLGLLLRQTSYSVFLQMDEAFNLEMVMEEGRTLRSLTKIHQVKIKKALALDELARKIIIVIERHQELYSTATLYAKHMDYECTINHMELFVPSVTLAFFISSETTIFHKLWLVVAALGVLLIWLVFCSIGEMFQKMNEIVATEIYDSPWYLLKPKDRRLVHIFLTIIRRPISIGIYGLYPMNLKFFPEILNAIYSKVQILRTLQFKRQKHS